ncbi:hypothetical protein L1887_40723 [Cichorium endivia]|nr:hypothetical protein L1887_40723 [Cichorium endivia]
MSNKIFGIHIGSKIQKFLKELDGDFLEIAKSLPRLCFLSGLTGEEMMMLLDAFPESGIVSRGTQKICNYTSAIGKSPSTMEEKSKFGKIILHPSLQRRIEHLASATANTKSHEAPFRNMLFYGPKIGMLQTTQL